MLFGILVFVMSIVLFSFWNSMFTVVYSGAKGMFGTWLTCLIVSSFLVMFAIGFIVKYLKWIIAIAVVMLGFMLFKKVSQRQVS